MYIAFLVFRLLGVLYVALFHQNHLKNLFLIGHENQIGLAVTPLVRIGKTVWLLLSAIYYVVILVLPLQ
jgi:hypothetical protein